MKNLLEFTLIFSNTRDVILKHFILNCRGLFEDVCAVLGVVDELLLAHIYFAIFEGADDLTCGDD